MIQVKWVTPFAVKEGGLLRNEKWKCCEALTLLGSKEQLCNDQTLAQAAGVPRV